MSTLYEDPFFDLHKKPVRGGRFRRGKASMDARVQFGKVPGEEKEEEEGTPADGEQKQDTAQDDIEKTVASTVDEKAKMRATT